MKFGLLTRNAKAWCSNQLVTIIRKKGIDLVCFRFSDVLARVACKPQVEVKDHDVYNDVDAVLVRPIGRGSLDEIIFRLDLLHRIERRGITVINSPSSIEKAVDKYYALTLLEENGIPVPRTIVTESPRRALRAFQELNGDVVIKPIFGSRGMGITRITNLEIARRIFRSLAFLHHVLYLQEFVPHGNRDIRAFVVGNKVVAAMYRVADTWRTNVSQGAKTVAFQPSDDIKKIAVTAAKILGCEIAGVDIMEGPSGYVINEINSQPGFKGLQSTTHTNIAEAIVNRLIAICS